MAQPDLKSIVRYLLIVGVSCCLAYAIDQYYVAGRGYTFFYAILKL